MKRGFTLKIKEMQKWEYDWDEIKEIHNVVNHYSRMKKRGAEGWELVSVIQIQFMGDNKVKFYWKRKLEDA